ncbi:hypothetical protein ASL14_14780 [Paenibacillus sp. IHB B 3084]|uniref:hypothetical protein n=1 Tax=Paenibacillus sp. IHB B 3084 TaxID=867076 RepID=UPI0007219EB5|nr:hypothetical protein [Paenibacillus sp. IHB B 3084]ALP37263.1 hypothetical protein ASL14_14780 [Paenibacillus sp. IHB B 3084]
MTAVNMQALLDELQHMTEAVLSNLLNLSEEEFEQFADQRQRIVEQMKLYQTSMTENDKQKIRDILNNDSLILQRMHILKDEAGHWIEKRGAIRVQQHAYRRAYAVDSLFIDHRK